MVPVSFRSEGEWLLFSDSIAFVNSADFGSQKHATEVYNPITWGTQHDSLRVLLNGGSKGSGRRI
jgi:hypothetical protein